MVDLRYRGFKAGSQTVNILCNTDDDQDMIKVCECGKIFEEYDKYGTPMPNRRKRVILGHIRFVSQSKDKYVIAQHKGMLAFLRNIKRQPSPEGEEGQTCVISRQLLRF